MTWFCLYKRISQIKLRCVIVGCVDYCLPSVMSSCCISSMRAIRTWLSSSWEASQLERRVNIEKRITNKQIT